MRGWITATPVVSKPGASTVSEDSYGRITVMGQAQGAKNRPKATLGGWTTPDTTPVLGYRHHDGGGSEYR